MRKRSSFHSRSRVKRPHHAGPIHRLAGGPGRPRGLANNSGDIGMAKPTQADAEAAVRVLIEWAGDDPSREGLIDTPGRVARSYRELFAGYAAELRDYLKRTFEEVGGLRRAGGAEGHPRGQLL